MRHRKLFITAAAAMAVGLLGLAPAANAGNNPGEGLLHHVSFGPTHISTGSSNITATYKGGTATFGTFTANCTSGGAAGTVNAGAVAPNGVFNFTSLSLTCQAPLGINATINLGSGVVATWTPTGGQQVNTWLIDGTTKDKTPAVKGDPVSGVLNVPSAAVTVNGTLCRATASGSTAANFSEPLKTGDLQELTLKGSGLSLSGQNFACLGLLSGAITLNNIQFNIASSAGYVNYEPAHS